MLEALASIAIAVVVTGLAIKFFDYVKNFNGPKDGQE